MPWSCRILEESWGYLYLMLGKTTTKCNGPRLDQPMKGKLLIIFAPVVVANVKRVEPEPYM
ncbi:hypothetical protein Ddye_014047 [Dipteronia dyeriana]|uniref:Uncharacterized protein n=1 Tax=Dipteronia dyeriana TaxID=168575 RepID=A0AAE0CK91_9ROSI|nr:hypothetical protein Ddye_014047 [Dipteronia dyeriana]